MIAASEKVYCFSSLGLEAGQWLCFRNQWCSEPSFWLEGILIQWEDRLWRHWCFGSWSWACERTEPSQDISDLPILARPPSQRPPLSSWRFSTTAPSLSSAGRVHPRGKITVGERICHRSCNGYILMYKKLDSKKNWHKWTYLQNRNRLTDIENKLLVMKVEGWEKGQMGSWEWHVHAAIFKTDN